jgi:hypothetical protein
MSSSNIRQRPFLLKLIEGKRYASLTPNGAVKTQSSGIWKNQGSISWQSDDYEL